MNSEEIKSMQAYARYAFGLDTEAAEVKAPEDEPVNESTRLAIVGLNIFESQRRTLEAALRDTELERDARGIILNHAIERAEAAGIHTGNSWYQAIDGMADTITALQSRVRELETALTPFAKAAQDIDVQHALPHEALYIMRGIQHALIETTQHQFLEVHHLLAAAAVLTDASSEPA